MFADSPSNWISPSPPLILTLIRLKLKYPYTLFGSFPSFLCLSSSILSRIQTPPLLAYLWQRTPINNHPYLSMLCACSPSTTLCRPATARPPRRPPSSWPPVVVAAYATFTHSDTSSKSRSSPLRPPEMATSCASFYEILGITAGATNEEIKTAYRRLARVCHPDVTAGGRKGAADEFMRIHAAYSTLSDPQKRAVYDGKLYRTSRPLTTVSSGFSGCRGRNWETDQCW